MRCHICRRFSWRPICQACETLYLTPFPKTRRLETGLEVLSFYAYDEIEPLLLTKHTPHGWFIYRQLARIAFASIETAHCLTYAIAIDDEVSGGYSHTALLARRLRSRGYRVLPGVLRAKNRISYAGKDRAFRIAHPRAFHYTGPSSIDGVLIDDIVTTGLTLQEAHGMLRRQGVDVLGAIVLADAAR